MRYSKADRENAVRRLREILKPGDTVYTVLRHVSRSGMQRRIALYKLVDGDYIYLSGYASTVLGERLADDGGIVVGGCGMDMGFHLVYNLSYCLWPDGHECIGEHCPSNDHSNGDRNYEPHHHRCGGYALKHRWI